MGNGKIDAVFVLKETIKILKGNRPEDAVSLAIGYIELALRLPDAENEQDLLAAICAFVKG